MNDTGVTVEQEFVFRRLNEAFPFATPEASVYCWWVLVIGVLVVGLAFIVWTYYRDARTGGGIAATFLSVLRFSVYLLLAFAFMLPAKQTWETSEKRSSVLILIDVSPSVSETPDDAPGSDGKAKTRLEKILDTLTDKDLDLMKNLTAKNAVIVYRFGSKVDDDPTTFKKDSSVWSKEEWQAWTRYDFKPFVLRGLSEKDKEEVTKRPAWGGSEPGTAAWAKAWLRAADDEVAPAKKVKNKEGKEETQYQLENAAAFADARGKLERRVDMARSIVQGTNLPDSMLGALTRESAGMIQGMIVFSDGRTNPGIDPTFDRLRKRPGEKVPVFTIAVGEARETASIVITDLQAPERASPDEPISVFVEADGLGLEGETVDVRLDLFQPGKDPRKDIPDAELKGTLKFEANDPPHGRLELKIEPDKLDDKLRTTVEKDGVKKKVMKTGAWNVVARIPKHAKEAYTNPFHVSPPRVINVVDSPLRVLLWASGPTREYQTMRTLLMREVESQRAEVSIFLQNEGGAAGEIAQDVEARRMLKAFPNRNDTRPPPTPEEKFYNLNEYDLIIAFDPDWTELSKDQLEMIANWVKVGGGGFVYVAGAINTHQLARTNNEGRMKPILEMMPVVPADRFVVAARPIPRTPRRLDLHPNDLFDVLKLDDTVPGDGSIDAKTAGWERFFTGKPKFVPAEDPAKNLNPLRGFYSYYPVERVKDGGNVVLAEFLDVDDRGVATPKPWLVVSPPIQHGHVAFFASGEMYRVRYPEQAFYERFWIRFARAMTVNRRNMQSFRGQVLVNKEYASEAMIRVAARILTPKYEPYAPNEIAPKFRIEVFDGVTKVKEFGPFPLEERQTGRKFDGYYHAQILADKTQFPPGEQRYRVVVDLPNSTEEPLKGEFMIKKSNVELDNVRPDFAAMNDAASTLEEVKAAVKNPETLSKLRDEKDGKAAKPDADIRMSYQIRDADREKIRLLPECIDSKQITLRNRGPVDDLWDRGVTVGHMDDEQRQPILFSYILFAAVGLLALEWTVRKLVRLA